MGEATIVLELADSSLFVVAADLGLVVRVHSTDVVTARVIDWHCLQKKNRCKVKSTSSVSLTS